MFVRFKDQKEELKDGAKVYEDYASIEERYQENGKIKTRYIATLGRKPSPKKMLETINQKDLEKNKEKLLRSFYQKANYISKNYQDFEGFLNHLGQKDALKEFKKEKALRNLVASSFDEIFDNLVKFDKINGKYEEVSIPHSNSQVDLLAKDKHNGEIVVIELKIGEVEDEVIGQINRYVNDIQDFLEDREVRGLVIGEKFSDKFDSGFRGLKNNIKTKEYSLNFKID